MGKTIRRQKSEYRRRPQITEDDQWTSNGWRESLHLAVTEALDLTQYEPQATMYEPEEDGEEVNALDSAFAFHTP